MNNLQFKKKAWAQIYFNKQKHVKTKQGNTYIQYSHRILKTPDQDMHMCSLPSLKLQNIQKYTAREKANES